VVNPTLKLQSPAELGADAFVAEVKKSRPKDKLFTPRLVAPPSTTILGAGLRHRQWAGCSFTPGGGSSLDSWRWPSDHPYGL
jgi:hypothetical protein